ncbi:unnamed protein product [Cuscuta campestris]|uniref:Uncharacterized protein n=1 Tax=Cuscuta campestris TaxID=132261 RepID=A0A484MMX9_9ASTE|nr:unnamed protein product [Cuscuta campestris]
MMAEGLVSKVTCWYIDWLEANTPKLGVDGGIADWHEAWVPPSPNSLKCNVDASFNLSAKIARVEMVVLDEQGRLMCRSSQGLG